MSPDLQTVYLGLELRNPLVASASPLTGDLDTLRELERAGAGAVVLPSLFEEQIERDELELHHVLESGAHSQAEALGYFPELEDYATGPGGYLELVAAAKRALSIPVIASLNGVTRGGWLRYAHLCEEAGADAIELNAYAVEANTETGAAHVEHELLDLVGDVRREVSVPVAVKVGPYYSAFANLAVRLAEAGADGIVCFNRFLGPDVDLETLTVEPGVRLSSSAELRLRLRWVAILRGRVAADLALTGGVHTAEDAVKAILVGADAVMLASALLRDGPGALTSVLAGMSAWLGDREYVSVEQARGSMSQVSCLDPASFERAQYMRALTSYRPRAQAS